MSRSLTVLRNQGQAARFKRLAQDDARTAIPPDAAKALETALKQQIDGEVRFDKGSRALYSTDGSNYRQVPIGVVLPRNADDVVNTVNLCRAHGAPVLSRGGGTSLAGQCCNVAVVMDFSKYMHAVKRIDKEGKLATVEPGCVLDDLRSAAVREANLTFGPDPETHDHCTLGGMIGNNSCGVHSLMCSNEGHGLRVSDNTHELEIVTYDGQRMRVGATSPEELEQIITSGTPQGKIYEKLKALRDKYADAIRQGYPKLGRRVSGYNLDDLLPENGFHVARALGGSESTLVTILEATVQLVEEPGARTLVIFGYPDIATGAEHTEKILAFKPIGLEGMDHLLFKFVKQKGDQQAAVEILPEGQGFLLVEFGGKDKAASDALAQRCIDAIQADAKPPTSAKLYDDPKQEKMVWDVREGGLGSTAWVPNMPDTWEGFEDSAVPVENIAPYLRDFRALLDKWGYQATLYGHLGQGCVHTRIPFDLYTADGIEKWRQFMAEATDMVVKHKGSFSGEHGDGQCRGEWLPKMFSPELLQAMREFKEIWDPHAKMNPGKGPVDPYKMTDNLRLGPDYNPPQPATHFSFQEDKYSFARAALRCVGVGKCRREGEGTMCPSYMVTREEKHSTRGRARMLFEMMNGEIIEDGWKSEEVYDALDLCLSCKGCKGDCPVNVDMATYKSEFLSHYYEGRVRPRHMFAFGFVHVWARLASVAPSLVNLATQTPGLSTIAKWMANVAPQRRIPQFAPQTLQQWVKHRPMKNPSGPPVVLFPDTFNNHFHVDTARCAVETLEDAGFRVIVPQQDLCCGRPLYDYGFLETAKRWWIKNLEILRPFLQASIPMVVLEPSCWAAFRDELINLMPADQDAKRLSELTFTLGEVLSHHAPQYNPPKLEVKAFLHGHCHQKSIEEIGDKEFGKLHGEIDLLKQMGVEFEMPATGCCGMAGAFGFEKGEHYETAVAAGERVILPAVRKLPQSTLIIADGFSCREQIEQGTDRQAMHLAQVIQYAKRAPAQTLSAPPESAMIARQRGEQRRALARVGLAAVVVAIGFVWIVRQRSGRQRREHQHG